jgi:hypothetical protein
LASIVDTMTGVKPMPSPIAPAEDQPLVNDFTRRVVENAFREAHLRHFAAVRKLDEATRDARLAGAAVDRAAKDLDEIRAALAAFRIPEPAATAASGVMSQSEFIAASLNELP